MFNNTFYNRLSDWFSISFSYLCLSFLPISFSLLQTRSASTSSFRSVSQVLYYAPSSSILALICFSSACLTHTNLHRLSISLIVMFLFHSLYVKNTVFIFTKDQWLIITIYKTIKSESKRMQFLTRFTLIRLSWSRQVYCKFLALL